MWVGVADSNEPQLFSNPNSKKLACEKSNFLNPSQDLPFERGASGVHRAYASVNPGLMVVIHCKSKSDEHQFLYETTVEALVSDVVKELVEIHNLRLRIFRLKVEGDELASHGPCRPPDKQGLDEDIQAEADGVVVGARSHTYCKDPNGKRDGNAPMAQVQVMLRKALDDAAMVASKKQVEQKIVTTKKSLLDAIDIIRGAVMIAYPMSIPEWDPVRLDIEADEKPGNTPSNADILDPATSQLWWAGKQMLPANKLSVHVGRNENTKVIAKLQKKGSGPPQREAPVSADEQKAMMAYYHKRQEEMKQLEQNNEDDYQNSRWADNGALKSHFSGVGGGRGGISLGGLGGRSGFN